MIVMIIKRNMIVMIIKRNMIVMIIKRNTMKIMSVVIRRVS